MSDAETNETILSHLYCRRRGHCSCERLRVTLRVECHNGHDLPSHTFGFFKRPQASDAKQS